MEQNKTTALYVASEKGDYERVKRLLGEGADVNEAISDDGCSSLYAASCNGHLDVVKTLLEAGANIDQVYKDGRRPLYIASLNGHLGVVKTLMEAGANINQTSMFVVMNRKELEKLACEALRFQHGVAKLAMTGNKAALVERLYLHLQDPSSEPEPER
ncbi:hypothetical protein EMCRGX_G005027 [Ephydatia muelleri]